MNSRIFIGIAFFAFTSIAFAQKLYQKFEPESLLAEETAAE